MEWYEVLAELVLVWSLWVVVHEASHALAAKLLMKAQDFHFKMYPHITEEKKFLFASVSYLVPVTARTEKKEALVLLAPRVMNLVAAIAFPFLLLFPMPMAMFWGILWGAGLIDLFVGSLGISSVSDLRKAAKLLKFNPTLIRVFGFTVILASIFASLSTQ